jgi:hypothetical protein
MAWCDFSLASPLMVYCFQGHVSHRYEEVDGACVFMGEMSRCSLAQMCNVLHME